MVVHPGSVRGRVGRDSSGRTLRYQPKRGAVMDTKLKHQIRQKPEVTDHLLSIMAEEYRSEILPYLGVRVRFVDFYLLPDRYREMVANLKRGGGLQSQGGAWRCV